MEYCNGGTLEEKMQGKLFSEVEAYDFLCQFCSGYRELYRQHIIHRGTALTSPSQISSRQTL